MNIFLSNINTTTTRADIYEFVAPALKNGLFRKPGRIMNIDILALRDLETSNIEYHGLVALDSQKTLQNSVHRLQSSTLNGKAISIKPYYYRSWYNDPRQHDMPPSSNYVEKRTGDRRRGKRLEVVNSVSEQFHAEQMSEPTPLPSKCGHYMVSFSVPSAKEAAVIKYFVKFDLESQLLPVHHTLNASHTQTIPMQKNSEDEFKHYQICAGKNDIDSLLDKLKAQCSRAGIRYWLAAVAESGEI